MSLAHGRRRRRGHDRGAGRRRQDGALRHVTHRATDAGCRVRFAAPGPLERHFRYGVIRALLEGPLREAGPEARAALLGGAAGLAGALLLDGTVPSADATTTVAHSFLWLCAGLAETRPLALLVDDAHWADRPSLEVLAFLARRLADFPVLVVVAARSGDPEAASDLLSMIGDGPHARTLHPQPLSEGGSAAARPGSTSRTRRPTSAAAATRAATGTRGLSPVSRG